MFAWSGAPNDVLRQQAAGLPRGLTENDLCCDPGDFEPRLCSIDLVVAIWMHLPPDLRGTALRRAVAALRPGGHLILEAPHPAPTAAGQRRGPPGLELLIEPEPLQCQLEGLALLILQERQRWIEAGPVHHGESAVGQVLGRRLAGLG